MHHFYSAAAQVLPVLFLAVAFELRTMSGEGPNVYEALGIPVQLPGAPRWFWRSYSTILVLVPRGYVRRRGGGPVRAVRTRADAGFVLLDCRRAGCAAYPPIEDPSDAPIA